MPAGFADVVPSDQPAPPSPAADLLRRTLQGAPSAAGTDDARPVEPLGSRTVECRVG